jgi:AraC-like DNA-binding protein
LDAERYPGQNTFDLFLELIAGFPLRSSFEYRDDAPFHSRWTSAQVGDGSAIRWSCAAHTTIRTDNDIADSSATGYGILYALSGGAQVIQNGEVLEANAGTAVIYDADAPAKVNMSETGSREYFFITFPRHLIHASAANDTFTSPARTLTMRSPLLHGLDYLAGVLARQSGEELERVYNACLHLFTADFLMAQRDDASSSRDECAAAYLLARMRVEIDREAGNTALSPEWLAERFGISVRHVHKVFASQGLTCQSYITDLRLNYARKDLCASSVKLRIATLAYRWGFNDPSSFGRAFRNRFGCSPGEFQRIVRE